MKRGPAPAELDSQRTTDAFTYQGHRFQGSGKYLSDPNVAGILSPNGAWLAVQSVDEKDSNNFLLGFRGMFYVDIFNALSARKQTTVRLYVTRGTPTTGTWWIRNNYLFLDAFELNKREFILCDASQFIK
jgi:hypothetical protein